MRHLRTAAFFLLGAMALAACGYGASAANSSSGGGAASGSGAKLTVESGKYGKVLALSSGATLYMFTPDTASVSKCTGGCAGLWPPVTSTHLVAGSGVQSSLMGSISRSGGGTQLTYNGHPLYTYAGDTAAGATSGQGISSYGGTWYVLSASGTPVKSATSSSGGYSGAGY